MNAQAEAFLCRREDPTDLQEPSFDL